MGTSPLICSSNQWTGFYIITASLMKGLSDNMLSYLLPYEKDFEKPEI